MCPEAGMWWQLPSHGWLVFLPSFLPELWPQAPGIFCCAKWCTRCWPRAGAWGWGDGPRGFQIHHRAQRLCSKEARNAAGQSASLLSSSLYICSWTICGRGGVGCSVCAHAVGPGKGGPFPSVAPCSQAWGWPLEGCQGNGWGAQEIKLQRGA